MQTKDKFDFDGEAYMADFSVNEMLEMQRTLQEKYKDQWGTLSPETGKNQMLWMIGEIGEVIDIIKKNGSTKASTDKEMKWLKK